MGTTVVEGTKETPVFFPKGMTIRHGSFYVTDHLGHTLTIFGLKDGTVNQLGREGVGPGEFRMPLDLAVDRGGHIYVNDGGNRRVQIFSPAREFVAQVPLPMEAQHVFPLPLDSPEGILAIGLKWCGPSVSCRATEVDMDGRIVRQYAPPQGPTKVSDTVATITSDGELFIANALGNTIQRYGTDGSEKSRLNLTSPAMIPFQDGQPEDKPADPYIVVKHLREDTYTLLEAIHVAEAQILVQLRVVNALGAESQYVLDAYSHDGQARHVGLEIPGRLVVDEDNLYFVDHDETFDYGRFAVHRYSVLEAQSDWR
jgi:hypothetical protein